MKSVLLMRFITFGAVVPHSSSAGEDARIDEAVIGVERDRKQRALLPFEDVLLGLAFEPDFGRAAALDHEADFLVQMCFSGLSAPAPGISTT